MKTKSWKMISVAVVLAVVLTGLVGCGTASPNTAPAVTAPASTVASTSTQATTPLPKLSFSVTTCQFGTDPAGKPVQDAWLKKCSELMGRELDINLQYINNADYPEKLKIMLASNTLPDMFTLSGLNQTEIVKYGDSGMFLDQNQYVNNGKMPNYKKLLDSAPHSVPDLVSKDGKLYATYFTNTNNLAVDGGHDIWYSAGFRKDIFEKNGIAIPSTLDELTAAAKKLKAAYPGKYPLFQVEEWQSPINILYSTNHVGQDRYFDGTKFQYGPLQEGYKEALMQMNLWVKDELLSPDYMTQKQANGTATMAAGDGMIIPAMWYGYPGYWETQYPDQKWVMVTGISNPKYGKPWSFGTYTVDDTSIITAWGVVINPKSKVVDDMVKFADIQLSEDINTVLNWGFEGETYTLSNGQKTFTDAFLKDPKAGEKYGIATGTCRPGIFPQIQDAISNAASVPQQDNIVDGKAIRAKYTVIKKDSFNPDEMNPNSLVKTSPLTTDEASEYANIITPINTYAQEQTAQFILGKRPFSEWDKFITELKKMGDIQKAMDLYNSHIIK